MTRSSQFARAKVPSINYRCGPLEGSSFDLAEFNNKGYNPTLSGKSERNGKNSDPMSSEVLSTAELISAVGQIWNCASRPLALLQPKTNFRHNDGELPQGNIFCNADVKENIRSSTCAYSGHSLVSVMDAAHSSSLVYANLEHLYISKKVSFLEPNGRNYIHSLFWRFMQSNSNISCKSWKEKTTASIGISYDLKNIYGWMNEMSVPAMKQLVNRSVIENKKICEWLPRDNTPTSYCTLGGTANPTNNLAIASTDSTDCHAEISKCLDQLSCQSTTPVASTSALSICSYRLLEGLQRTDANGHMLTPMQTPHTDLYIKNLASDSHASEESQHDNEDGNLYVNKMNQQSELALADKTKMEVCSPTINKSYYGLAKQEHAFAGALAGIFVSLCLHPVDTIKTVIQSCHTNQRSLNYICRSIISDRGVTGLYRGITSNIASSAPISAVYTVTYESVKGALLPFLPMKYESFAHCTAGGCASIATSFIFTPSERIKQQMQVGSHYQNCWSALAGIIKRGGLPSLYAGWGAVLCRNVPHSIIKFYTYESLKRLMLSSVELNARPNTLQTLVCGGLAGSTAALFTTPFDVVKTRLQTQIPGSVHQYDGVFNTLVKISKHEGLTGLYRGLIPRLFMYISQGAIFFASYESFKRLFSVEMPHLYSQMECMQSMEDDRP
ncbi:uncharacterized protein LOC127813532 [Diospyros lotus]|uniref:uncharacterized protein LOC127813532 n=1 Tax=Diospyros lotus TaxID=55363 RepID=UPI002250D9FB|nr:uncharacterized protein LOC127813532 [Diospyros lotus]XP_052210506.1 uncharacterized protein LOC127813532 [Diospyros lotus]XP_052210507.1 uncharacterized protein LOC127813532 [Diospyros lotus]